MSALVDRFVASSDMDKAMRMLVVQTIGFEVAASPLLLDTLCACFDNLDSKTGACEQLGIRRQTPVQPTGQSDTNGRRRL